jgi:nicotinate-nucleotide adenylyltransferase
MKIAIYGGSFDPPHIGHLNVVLHALNNYDDIYRLYVIPCFKQTGKNLTDFSHRLNMCKETFGNLPRVIVTPVEANLGGESLTLNTVRYFYMVLQSTDDKHYHPEIVLICGSDTASKIPDWEGGKELMELVEIREAPRTNISSTEIRDSFKRDNPRGTNKITRSVCSYIKDNYLYK